MEEIKTTSEDNRMSGDVGVETEGSVLIPKINFGQTKTKKRIGIKYKLNFMKNRKHLRIILAVLTVFLVFVVLTSFLFYRVYTKATSLKDQAHVLVSASKSQDIEIINKEIVNTQNSLSDFQKSYKSVAWAKIMPFFGKYVDDGEHLIKAGLYSLDTAKIVINIIEPYADIIGFTSNGAQASSPGESAQERIDFVVKTIPDVIPKSDDLIGNVVLIEKELSFVNPDDYPEEFRDMKIRSSIKEGLDQFTTISRFVKNGKPFLESLPYLIGSEGERKYLVLFQNDKELRPTGGFITAYSIAKVDQGKFEPVLSSDIYNLDDSYTPKITAPEPLVKYLQGPYTLLKKYRLRDMNWSPDFPTSMELFLDEAKTAGVTGVDGIIAVDTSLLVNLLDVLGEIGVSGYGNFSTKIVPECNCPQVIYELESFADIEGPIVWSENEPGKIVYAPANYDNRKKIIGPLMNAILSNTLGQPKEKFPLLFNAVIKSILEKNVLVYTVDDKVQKAVEDFGLGGKIIDFEGDYLHINDANLGGRKSNLYVTSDVEQKINIAKDGSVEKTVTITYKNPEKYDGWLNSVLPNWVRIYVPKGSVLTEFDGVEEKEEPYEELNKTVFAGFFKLRPQGIAKITLTYKLPFKVDKQYKLYIQKQPGKSSSLYTIEIGNQITEEYLSGDKEIRFSI